MLARVCAMLVVGAVGALAYGQEAAAPADGAPARAGQQEREGLDGSTGPLTRGPVVRRVTFLRETGVCDATLANNVVLHHARLPEPVGRFRLVVTVAGGEIHEGAGQSGLTQLAVAGWAQEGARAAASEQVAAAASAYGLSVKASALPDHVRLAIEGPAEGAATAARLARTLLSEPVVTAEALAAQRVEIERAVEMIAGSRWGVIGSAMIGTVYPEDPRLRLPTASQLRAHSAEDAQAWLEQILARGPVEAAVVGDVSVETALGAVAAEFAALPDRGRISPRTFVGARTLAPPAGAVEATVQGTTPEGRAVVVAGFPGADVSNVREFRALWIAARVLEGRIVERITEQGPPLTDLQATCAPGAALPGFGMVFAAASCAPANGAALAAAMKAELARLRTEPPTADEVAQAAATMKRSVAELNADAGYWAEVLSTSQFRGVDMDAIARGEQDYATMSAADVGRVLEKWNVEEGRFVIVVIPE